MDDLTLFGDKRMTVREVAEALGTAESTIRNKAAELFPDLVKNGVATLLDEKQVFELKKNLVPRDLTLKSKLDSAETSLDIEEMTLLTYIKKAGIPYKGHGGRKTKIEIVG